MSVRVGIIGLGLHGRGIAESIVNQGAHLSGGADPAHVGQPLTEVLNDVRAPATAVVADSSELLADDRPDVVIITAPVNLDGLGALSLPFLDAGVDVLTIHPDAFDPPQAWGTLIDQRAQKGGASFLSTGVQDVWWVHVPAVAAASTTALRRVEFAHVTDMNTLSLGLGQLFGVGKDESEFAQIREEVLLGEASVLGGPMRVLARRLGLTPGDAQRRYDPLLATQPTAWSTGDAEIETGKLIGFLATVRVETLEGVDFEGTLRTALLEPGELPSDNVTLHGDPVISLEHRPFPGARITNIVPMARVNDLVAAPPGLHTAASLPPASYRHPTPASLDAP